VSDHDSSRIKKLLEIGGIYEFRDPDRVIKYLEEALELAETNIDDDPVFLKLRIDALQRIGVAYMNQNIPDKALKNLMRALQLSEEIDYKQGEAAANNGMGMVHDDLKDYELAIEYYKRSLSISEDINDEIGMARALNNIGIVYGRLNDFRQAIRYYLKAADVFEAIGNEYYLAAIYNNLGTYYLALAPTTDDKDSALNHGQQALHYFHVATHYFEELEKSFHFTTSLGNMALIHQKIANLLPENHPERNQHLEKSISYGHRSLSLSNEIKDFHTIFYAANALKNTYKLIGDTARALEMAEIVIENNDSLFVLERHRLSAEIEADYQLERQRQELEKQHLITSRQNVQKNALLIGLILMILLATTLYYGYSNKMKINAIINKKNDILEEANRKILSQRDELTEQRDMVMMQNKTLEEMNSHITSSLQYAQSIQAAILPSVATLKKICLDYFVLIKPCELVSGDFFWATSFDEYKVFCVTDCTGHGVPGAFMSILGVTALNDIVVKHQLTQPNEILDYLRRSVIEALSQNDPEHLHKDGMDIALCVFNSNTRELHFAGAGLPLWIIPEAELKLETDRVKRFTLKDTTLYEVKPDFMPVGKSPNMRPFTCTTIKIAKVALAFTYQPMDISISLVAPSMPNTVPLGLRSRLLKIITFLLTNRA